MGTFLLNLNIFIPTIACLSFAFGWSFSLLIARTLIPLNRELLNLALFKNWDEMTLAQGEAIGFFVFLLGFIWWRVGLSPRKVALTKERRFVKGHLTVAITTCVTAAYIVLPWVAAKATDKVEYLLIYASGFFVLPIAGALWLSGLSLVWSSCETAADLASPDYRWLARNSKKAKR